MSEEQLKAAETETETAQVEDGVEEISEEDLAGVAGGRQAQSTYIPNNQLTPDTIS